MAKKQTLIVVREDYFIGSMPLNTPDPYENMEWKDSYYPYYEDSYGHPKQ